MTPRAKTIQIFLPAGDPRGIRIAEITTRIVQVIEVPRSLLADFLAMPESTQVALYFLVGETEDGSEDTVYVGQTGDLRARLTAHNKEKDFWERALVLISRTNSLTQTHALFLEWHCIQSIRAAGRFRDENGNKGSRPFTPAPLEADCLEIFETAQSLTATLGFPLFHAVAGPAVPSYSRTRADHSTTLRPEAAHRQSGYARHSSHRVCSRRNASSCASPVTTSSGRRAGRPAYSSAAAPTDGSSG